MAELYRGDGSIFSIGLDGTALTVVGGVNSVDYSGFEQASIDTFSRSSTSKTSRPSKLPDYGTASVEAYYDPADAGQVIAIDASTSGATVYFSEESAAVDGTGTSTISGVGYVTKFAFSDMKTDSNVVAKFDIKINSID